MAKSLKFGLIGAAGFVAPRHMAAIRAIGGDLIAACDIHDSVGILDSYFPGCRYISDPTNFYEYCGEASVNYISICLPNYLHYQHCKQVLLTGADAIIEKPIFINSYDFRMIFNEIHATPWSVWPILQCRLHPAVMAWKSRHITSAKHRVNVEYLTPRGRWYHDSWKGDIRMSGGLAFNIGVHLFDLCCYLFGKVISRAGTVSHDSACGHLEMEYASIDWLISIKAGLQPKRLFTVDGEHIDLTNGFEDLHTEAYRRIIEGRSWTMLDAKPAIEICERLNAAG